MDKSEHACCKEALPCSHWVFLLLLFCSGGGGVVFVCVCACVCVCVCVKGLGDLGGEGGVTADGICYWYFDNTVLLTCVWCVCVYVCV